jgi:hypothetical protein
MIKFYLHTPELPGWDYVFADMIEKMATSGLVEAADEINLCLNGKLDTMMPIIKPLLEISNKFIARHVNNDANKWEWPSIDAVKSDCNVNDGQNHYIGYAHLKGLSRLNVNDPAAKDWRDYLVYWTIERWKTNIEKLSDGYTGSGVNWFDKPFSHYSGNFWWASSDYLKSLDPLQDPSTVTPGQVSKLIKDFHTGKFEELTKKNVRFESEAWIGSGAANARMYEIHASPMKNNHHFEFHYQNRYPASNYREDQ